MCFQLYWLNRKETHGDFIWDEKEDLRMKNYAFYLPKWWFINWLQTEFIQSMLKSQQSIERCVHGKICCDTIQFVGLKNPSKHFYGELEVWLQSSVFSLLPSSHLYKNVEEVSFVKRVEYFCMQNIRYSANKFIHVNFQTAHRKRAHCIDPSWAFSIHFFEML